MIRIRNQSRSETQTVARVLVFSGALLGLASAGGCGKVSSGVGGESHFVCETDADCAPHDGVPFCVNKFCQSTAGRPVSDGGGNAGSGGSGSGGRGVDSGAAGARASGGGNAGASGGSPASGGAGPSACVGTCCPTDPTCYSDSSKGADSPGAECLATHDNTGQDHIQLRQAWVQSLKPLGTTQSIVYGVLAGRAEVPAPVCYQGRSPSGSGGYIELVDLYLGGSRHTPGDISGDYSVTGFAQYASRASLSSTLVAGFCYGAEQYAGDAGYRLPTSQMSPSLGYPVGLPHPMGLADGPWRVGPTKAKRLASDFDLGTSRTDLLAKLDSTTGEYGTQGFGGVFYYDEVTGSVHGYASLAWSVLYAIDGQSHIAIPMREVETRSTFNNPAIPDCVGTYRAGALDPSSSPTCGSNDPANPAWGEGRCGDHTCDPASKEGPATTQGYVLITELQQIYSPDLLSTLCVAYPTETEVNKQGFYDQATSGCVTASWDPTKADGSGIPRGDWCAATNGPATGTCHDAWRTESIQVLTGAKIKVPSDPTAPMTTCSF